MNKRDYKLTPEQMVQVFLGIAFILLVTYLRMG